MTTTKKIAYAQPANIEGTIYSVTYSDDRAMDANVGRGYLALLRRKGYRVEIEACPAQPATVLHPHA